MKRVVLWIWVPQKGWVALATYDHHDIAQRDKEEITRGVCPARILPRGHTPRNPPLDC